ncbi:MULTISPECIES: hypothetical protein [Gordonia]|uniref:Uncharacterized protein n=1 Tax=Gordonia amicalis TaxID=89053 RepID=A0AAE4R454_9ACTN|nr:MULTISPECIES: hypothetical protein [Gordonia]ATD69276.1 hypothetical protein CNO18_02115 [Gordonia sp. 1D]KAF0968842.1 hypothetical protein BPODLACK_02497 [Gordonia sp. YY1]MCR8899048.1 hypothetical protein [Gordonia sp. GONU]MCZ0911250.1 hypothetical protein [Gordonia amicalis]MCZ4579408.1 hypothetical protein [Gordonia amicalis]
MSDFIRKIKEEAKAVSAAIDQELTVLEGVPGYDPLADEKDVEAAADEPTAADEAEGEPSR